MNKAIVICRLVVVVAGTLCLSSCSKAPQQAPKVLGIPFAVPVTQIKQFLPEDAKPEQFPLIPLYGYKLRYANPENWAVLVQEEAPNDLVENAIFTIYTTRTLEHECTRGDTKAMVETVKAKYSSTFAHAFVNELPDERAYGFIAVSDRSMLTVVIRCFARTLGASFIYVDLDKYKYQKPEEMALLITKSREEARAYESRTFKP